MVVVTGCEQVGRGSYNGLRAALFTASELARVLAIVHSSTAAACVRKVLKDLLMNALGPGPSTSIQPGPRRKL